jgi:23S rRNA (cytosine1962-C5)-methyltransferase
MIQEITEPWSDYELLSTGDGQRLERFGKVVVARPDCNVIWPKKPETEALWATAQAIFHAYKETGEWQYLDSKLTSGWTLEYKDCVFHVRPTPFRHLGLFPEQAVQWQWLTELIQKHVSNKRHLKVLNVFGYTGAGSVVAGLAGASVCHVDASPGSVQWAKENAALSNVPDTSIRYIVDDVLKFMQREVRRGNTYDIILMDPPVFGRGPKGEIWRLANGLGELAGLSKQLMSENPVAILVNFYATALYPGSAERVFQEVFKDTVKFNLGSVHLKETSGALLPTGFFLKATF